jgi:hypothetical protein
MEADSLKMSSIAAFNSALVMVNDEEVADKSELEYTFFCCGHYLYSITFKYQIFI